MEFHPLNLAHQQHRRAEAHMKYKRFDDAMECHNNAAELLLDAMKSTTSSVALESITLQHSYHLKQKDLIKIKKEQCARVKKAMDNLKQMGKEPDPPCNENSNVQVAIYKTLNETGHLLDNLASKKCDKIPKIKESEVKPFLRDEQNVIDDILHLNRNLHSLVDELVTQVEVLKDENMTLNERVKYLEKERAKYLNIQIPDFMPHANFSDLSLSNEGFQQPLPLKMNLPSVASNQINKTYGTSVARPVQQPHFDLSAFKDD